MDILGDRNNWPCIVVLTNLPDIHHDTIENYLEVVCQGTVTRVCVLPHCSQAAIALFDKPISGQENWPKRPLHGAAVITEHIGKPSGVYIANLPSGVDKDFLTLFFESSKKSGGTSDCVDRVEIHIIDHVSHAVVFINDFSAILSILSFKGHQLKKTSIQVEPYFKTLHPFVIEHLKSGNTSKQPTSTTAVSPNPRTQPQASVSSTPHGDSKHSHTAAKLNIFEEPVSKPPLMPIRQRGIVQPVETMDNQASSQLGHSPVQHTEGKGFISDNMAGHQNVAAVKPTIRLRDSAIDETMGHSWKTKDIPISKELSFAKNVQVLPDKVRLLIMARFARDNNSETVEIVLKVNEGLVSISASTQQKLIEMEVKMHEILSKVLKRNTDYPNSVCKFFAGQECLKCIRTKLKDKNIKTTVTIDTSRNMLVCSALADIEIDKALRLINDALTTRSVDVQPNQSLAAHKVVEMFNKKNLIGVYITEGGRKVEIVSLFEDKAASMHREVLKYLEDNTSRNKCTFTLENAKARCFKQLYYRQLKKDFQKPGVQLDIDEKPTGSDVKIHVCLTGEDDDIALLNKIVGNIWHEKIDLKQVSHDEEDEWLIAKGLQGKDGDKFLKKCEDELHCFLDVSKTGQLAPPSKRRPRVVVEQPPLGLVASSDSDSSDDQLSQSFEHDRAIGQSHIQSDSEDEFEKTVDVPKPNDHQQKRRAKAKSYEFQGRMSTEAAMALALKQSLEQSELERPQQETEHLQCYRGGYQGGAFGMQDEKCRFVQQQSDSDDDLETEHIVHMGLTSVKIQKGEIAKFQADVLVNIVSPKHNLQESVVSKAFLKLGGDQLAMDYAMCLSGLGETEFLIKTPSSGKLRCQFVYHMALQKTGNNQRIAAACIEKVIEEVVSECTGDGCCSLAIPPLGVGRMYNYPLQMVAEHMLSSLSKSLQKATSQLQNVTIVIYDEETYNAFVKSMCSWQREPQLSMLHGLGLGNVRQHPFPRPFPQPLPSSQIVNPNRPQRHLVKPSFDDFPNVRGMRSNKTPHLHQQHQQQKSDGARGFERNSTDRHRSAHSRTTDDQSHRPRSAQYRSNDDRPHVQHSRSNESFDNTDTGMVSSRGRSSNRHRGKGQQRAHSLDRHQHHRASSSDAHSSKNSSDSTQQRKSSQTRASRYPEEKPLAKIQIRVVHESKEKCLKASRDLTRKIKEDCLYQEKCSKRKNITKATKEKIVKVVVHYNIKSKKEKDLYILRGRRESVSEAHKEILQLLLDEPNKDIDTRQKKKDGAKRGTPEFVKFMSSDQPTVPKYWKSYKPGLISSIITSVKSHLNKNYEKVELKSGDPCYKAIVDMINKTFDPNKVGHGKDAAGLDMIGHSKLWVVKVERVENLDLYTKYCHKRTQMFRSLTRDKKGNWPKVENLPGSSAPLETEKYIRGCMKQDLYPEEINEVYLFHGSKSDNINTICNDGLDARLGSGEAMFGSGVYGAEMAAKADQYADDKTARSQGPLTMFLIRMLLGNCFICKELNPHKYLRAPCCRCYKDKCAHESRKFDSIVGDNKKLFREFVVYHGEQCYPEYLITYKRR